MSRNRYVSLSLTLIGLLAHTPRDLRAQPCRAWESLSSAPALQRPAMSFDLARGVVTLIGRNAAREAETWTWNGVAWQLAARGEAPGLIDHATAFHAANATTILFGGESQYGLSAETWVWNGQHWTRHIGVGPPARTGARMAFDAERGVTVLYGGTGVGGRLGDTWVWDGNAWAQRATGGPTPRDGFALAYDPIRRATILVGGRANTLLDDTWAWNGVEWIELIASGAPSTANAAMAFDSIAGALTLHGGDDGWFDLRETWALQGSQWVLRANAGPGRANHALAWDDVRGELVMHCGQGADTWAWRGGRWTQVHQLAPQPRSSSAITYDATRAMTVLFGGQTGAGAFDEVTYELREDGWTARSIPGPGGRIGHSMTFDSNRGVVVLYGGAFDRPRIGWNFTDTWEYDGSEWSVRSHGPVGRRDVALAYDTARDRIVMLARQITNTGIFEWNGHSWTRVLDSDSLDGEQGSPAAYDPVRGCVVFYAGATTSTWDGATMRTFASSNVPSRSFAGMTWHSGRQAVVLYGGGSRNDLWEWNGAAWAAVPTVGQRPPPRSGTFGFAYDPNRDRLVLFGGATADPSAIWEFEGSRWAQVSALLMYRAPGRTMTFDPDHGGVMLLCETIPSTGIAELRVWDGVDLRSVAVGGIEQRSGTATVWDAAHSRLVAFGGAASSSSIGRAQTSAYQNEQWRVLGDNPYLGLNVAMVFDAHRGVTVAHSDDATEGGTWEWEGVTWIPRATSGPRRGRMAFDSVRQVCVLVESAELGDSRTWEWDGDAWALRGDAPVHPDSAFDVHFDTSIQSVVLLIQSDCSTEFWIWDGTVWHLRPYTACLSGSIRCVTFDTAHQRAILFDGNTGGTFALGASSLPGDVDANGSVELQDLVILLSNFGRPGAGSGDLDDDADVDFSDLMILLDAFGNRCP